MEYKNPYSPSLRRLSPARKNQTEPIRTGDEGSDAKLTIFLHPYSKNCRAFFTDVKDDLEHALLADTSIQNLEYEYRPVAPEMRMWITSLAADVKEIVGVSGEDMRASIAAEFLYAVWNRGNQNALLSAAERVCGARDAMLSLDVLQRIEEKQGVEGALKDVEQGEYRAEVRRDSKYWFRKAARQSVQQPFKESVVYLNGELIEVVEASSVVEKVRAVHEWKGFEAEVAEG